MTTQRDGSKRTRAALETASAVGATKADELQKRLDEAKGVGHRQIAVDAIAELRRLREAEPVAWRYEVNHNFLEFSEEKPPDDAYDEGTLTPLYASPQETPAGWRPTHRHVKRGSTYRVIGQGKLQCNDWQWLDDLPVTIYEGEDGALWVRSTAEFNDGRFEPVLEDAPPKEKP